MSTSPAEHYVIPAWSIGDRLRKIRREVMGHMSQEQMAELLDVPKARYSSWENGNGSPRSKDQIALAKRVEMLTRVPATWLLGLDDSVPTSPGGGSPKSDQVSDPRTSD